MKIKPFVVSISAVSGGGKTTITNHLSSQLSHSKSIYFDDYEFEGAPDDIIQWVKDGSNHNQWNLSPFIHDIQSMLTEPDLDYIILDYPFSYLHDEMKKYIDFAIFIDTPLDIALARRIIRDYEGHRVIDIQRDMEGYLHRGRIAYLDMLQTTRPNSDLIIDGTLKLEDIIDKMIKAVQKQRYLNHSAS